MPTKNEPAPPGKVREPQTPDKNAVVAKNKHVLSKLAPLSLAELRLLAFCLAHYDSRNRDNREFTARVADLARIFPMDAKSAYAVVRKAVNSINQKPFTDEYTTAEGEMVDVTCYWFSGFRYFRQSGKFSFSLSPEIIPYLLELKGQFTEYRLRDVYQFRSAATWKLYEQLKAWEPRGDWNPSGKWSVSLDELYVLLDVAGKYPQWDNFKKWVLDKAIKDINKQSDLVVDYEKDKKGRKVIGVVFFVQPRDPATRTEDPDIVANIGDTDLDVRALMAEGLNQSVALQLSRLAAEAGKDLGYYLEAVAERWEAMPEEERRKSRSAYIHGALRREFEGDLFEYVGSPPLAPEKPLEAPERDEPEGSQDPVWSEVKKILAESLSPDALAAWIAPLGFRREGTVAILTGPNTFFNRYVKKNFGEALDLALRTAGFTTYELPLDQV